MMVVCGPCQESTSSTQERGKQLRRKRFQKGSLQIRKHGRHRVWVACYWEGGGRRSKVLGRCSQMGKGEAESILSAILQPINKGLAREPKPVYTFEQFVESVYLPFCRRSWKESTEGTSEQIVKTHLCSEFGKQLLHAVRRDELQDFLDRSALVLGSSVVKHLRWFLNAIFKLAVSDGLVLSNPAAELRIPKKCRPGRAMRPLTEEEVMDYLEVFDLRERLIARLAVFRRSAAGRDLCYPMEGRPERCDKSRAARVQAHLRYPEERQNARGSHLGRDVGAAKGVARPRGGSESGGIRLPERDASYVSIGRQPLAPDDEAEAGEGWLRMGDLPGPTEDQRQSVEEGGCRSEGRIGPEGPRYRRQPGGVYQFGPGAEAGSSEQTRGRVASKTATPEALSMSVTGLME